MNLQRDIIEAMRRDGALTLARYAASIDDLYEWLRTTGPSVVDRSMSGWSILSSFATDEARREATFSVGGGRIGEVRITYRVVDGGLENGQPSAELHFDGAWVKPRFLADSFGAGQILLGATFGMWNDAAKRFAQIEQR